MHSSPQKKKNEWMNEWRRRRRVCFACSHFRVGSLVPFKNIYTAFYHDNVGIDHGLLSEWEKIFWPAQRCLESHWRRWIWTAVFDNKMDRILLTKLTLNPSWDHQLDYSFIRNQYVDVINNKHMHGWLVFRLEHRDPKWFLKKAEQ